MSGSDEPTKKFKVGIIWTVSKDVVIEAKSDGHAKNIAESMPLPDDVKDMDPLIELDGIEEVE